MLMSPYISEVIEVVLAERVAVIATGGGNPGVYIPRFKEAGCKVVPVVSTVALARRLERLGVDAVIAEGMESGGHVGETSTIALLPQVVDSVKIPVIAAGGIADGRGLVAALALGAKGIQMGTRFISTEECIAHPKFKESIIRSQDRATSVTGASMGHPIRCIENKLTRQFMVLEKSGAPETELMELGRGKLFSGVIEGNIEEGSLMAGQIAGLIKETKPVKAVIEDIMAEAEKIIDSLGEVKSKEA